ncbi:hypothetical protein D3C81_1435440 [compost metagenome]
MRRGGLAGVRIAAVEALVAFHGLRQPCEEVAGQLPVGRGAEADGCGHALALGHAVVRVVGRQIQHVAGFQHPFLLGREVRQDLQRHVGNQVEPGL